MCQHKFKELIIKESKKKNEHKTFFIKVKKPIHKKID